MIQQQMKELNELRTRKKVLVSAMAQIIDTSAPQGLTEEQENAYQAHKEQLTDINGRLRTFEDMAALELPRAIRELPDSALAGGDSWQQPASRARGRRYRDLFPESAQAKNDGGFQNFAEFLSVLHSGRFDERLNSIQISATMSEGIGSAGGFLVPEEFSSWLLDTSLEDEIVRPRATVYPMLSATRKVPGWDGQDHSTSLFGGFTGTWLAENGSATEVDPKLRLIELTARKLACFTKSSNELIADGLGLEQQLTSALVRALGWYLDLAFLTGTGAGQPLGVLNDAALVTVAKEVGQATSTIVWPNIAKMFARLHPACVKNSVWVCNNSAIPQLLQLTINVGTAGSVVPVFSESNGKFSMLTKPVIFTEKLPALGSKGDVLLVDLSQYAVGIRKEISLDKSNAPGWLQDQSSYRAIVRADGMGMWNSAVTPRNGDSLSWCVTLAARV